MFHCAVRETIFLFHCLRIVTKSTRSVSLHCCGNTLDYFESLHLTRISILYQTKNHYQIKPGVCTETLQQSWSVLNSLMFISLGEILCNKRHFISVYLPGFLEFHILLSLIGWSLSATFLLVCQRLVTKHVKSKHSKFCVASLAATKHKIDKFNMGNKI